MKTSELLINWFEKNARNLPWRKTTDPYKIWLSEIMLQQTRVEQGTPYYHKFVEAFPTVHELAKASENQVLQLWQGLGYYSRARNLHHTAKIISKEFNGIFPSDYNSIIKLKGIGDYTASAIASFAFNLPHPTIDGNVQRVITRLFAIDKDIASSQGKKEIKIAVNSIFDTSNPGTFNQAAMELGALICKPHKPNCSECPVNANCLAFKHQNQLAFPVKIKKTKVTSIHHTYLVFKYKEKTFVEKRTEGIWQQLYQFPLVEKDLNANEVPVEIEKLVGNTPFEIHNNLTIKHLLSHRKITAEFYTIYLKHKPNFLKTTIFEIPITELGNSYPISVLTQKYLDK